MLLEAGVRYRIDYESEAGTRSRREIDVLRVEGSPWGAVYVRAYCRLRRGERTFRLDRIQAAVRLPPEPDAAARLRAAPVQAALVPAAPRPLAMPSPAAAVSASSREDPRANGVPSRERFSLGGFLTKVAVYAAVIVIFGSAMAENGLLDIGYTPSIYGSHPASIPKPAPAPRPAPPPRPSVEESSVAGVVLRTVRDATGERYEVPTLGLSTRDKLEAVAAIRLPRFVEATGLTDPRLISLYLEADLNRSGKLSFDELSAFQTRTFRDFRYLENEYALRPDLFLDARGGDCEDFALYTAGLLRFWGWEPYIGSMGSSRGGVGHALCLSYEEGSFPGGFAYFSLADWRAEDGSEIPSGRYVPVDYDHVGSLSNAVEPHWKLREVYVPERAWGLRM